jgi:hypothetical protein
MTTSPIPTIVTTSQNGKLRNEIIIPDNAPEIMDAARNSLAWMRSEVNAERFTDGGDSEKWAKFSGLSGIY